MPAQEPEQGRQCRADEHPCLAGPPPGHAADRPTPSAARAHDLDVL